MGNGMLKQIKKYIYIVLCGRVHRNAVRMLGSIYALYGAINMFANIKIYNIDSWLELWKIAAAFVCVYVAAFTASSIYDLSINKHKLFNLCNGHMAYYLYGNILDPHIINSKNKNIIISVNRCFDTEVDNEIISETSLHGQCFKLLYESHVYTSIKLRNKIADFLQSINAQGEEYTEKKRGNKTRYPVGTVAEVPAGDTKYFLVALSTFQGDSTLTTTEEYSLVLARLFERICLRSQGHPVFIPLIGGGLSKTGIDDHILFSMLTNFILIYKDKIHCDIYIVLDTNNKYKIPRKSSS